MRAVWWLMAVLLLVSASARADDNASSKEALPAGGGAQARAGTMDLGKSAPSVCKPVRKPSGPVYALGPGAMDFGFISVDSLKRAGWLLNRLDSFFVRRAYAANPTCPGPNCGLLPVEGRCPGDYLCDAQHNLYTCCGTCGCVSVEYASYDMPQQQPNPIALIHCADSSSGSGCTNCNGACDVYGYAYFFWPEKVTGCTCG